MTLYTHRETIRKIGPDKIVKISCGEKKIRGIYFRGKTYWFAHGAGKRRLQVSLETTDYVEAVPRAQAIWDNPLLTATDGFKTELDKFADAQMDSGTWTKNSRDSKYPVLLMFGEDLGFPSLISIKTDQIQKWYNGQVKRIKVVTVNPYMTTIKSFFNWAIEARKMFRNPADEVKQNQTPGAARERFCTFDGRDEIIHKAPTMELKFVLHSGFFAGYRKNEIIEARPGWFDMSLKHVHVIKLTRLTRRIRKNERFPWRTIFIIFWWNMASLRRSCWHPMLHKARANTGMISGGRSRNIWRALGTGG